MWEVTPECLITVQEGGFDPDCLEPSVRCVRSHRQIFPMGILQSHSYFKADPQLVGHRDALPKGAEEGERLRLLDCIFTQERA